MAIQWGNWASTGSQRSRIGIDLSVSGTTITARYYGQTEYAASSGSTLTRTGASTGTSTHQISHGSSGGQTLLATHTRTGSRGSSYTFGASWRINYNSLNASVSGVSITVPALVPSKPSRPTVSGVGTTTATANLGSAPASNGAAILEYRWQVEGHSTWTSGTSRTRAITGLTANSGYRVRVWARNSVGWGEYSDYSTTFTTAPLAPSAAAAPVVTRNSDTSHGLAVTIAASSTRPVTTVTIERRTFNGSWGGWQVTHTITGNWTSNTSISRTDTGTVGNRAYGWRVKQANSATTTIGTSSGTVRTRPTSPHNLTAGKTASGDIRVTATAQHVVTGTYEWRNNGSALGTSSSASYTHVDPSPTTPHSYTARVAVASNTSSGTLYSDWSSPSNTVQLITPPLAPTLTSPANGAYRPVDSPVPFAWTHNSQDTTEQTAARITIDGTPYTVTTEQQYADTLTEGAHTWKVETKGQHPDYGPASALRTVNVAARPVISLEDPDPNVSVARLDFTVDQAIVSYTATLSTADGVIEQITGTASPASFTTALLDATDYTARLEVTAQITGLKSTAELRTWTTDFPQPAPSTAHLSYEEADGSVGLDIQGASPPSTVEATSVDVERSIDGGPWEVVARGLDPNTYLLDREAVIGGVNEYRITTWSDLPSLTSVTAQIETPLDHTDHVYLSGGPGYEIVLATELTAYKKTPQLDVAVIDLVGKPTPTALYGDGYSEHVIATAKIERMTDLRTWERLIRHNGPVLFRAQDGTRIYGALTATASTDNKRIDFTIKEAD